MIALVFSTWSCEEYIDFAQIELGLNGQAVISSKTEAYNQKESISFTDITEITFEWTTSDAADGYQIIINEFIVETNPELLTTSSWKPDSTFAGMLPCSPSPYSWRVRAKNDFQYTYGSESYFFINDGDSPIATVDLPGETDTCVCDSDSVNPSTNGNCETLDPRCHMWHPLDFTIDTTDTTGIVQAEVIVTNNTTGEVTDTVSIFNSTMSSSPEFSLPVHLPSKMALGCDQTFEFTFYDCGDNTETLTMPVYLHPQQPEIISPDGTLICTASPTLQWYGVIGAEFYELELYEGTDTTGTLLFADTHMSTMPADLSPEDSFTESLILPIKLDQQKEYLWRVRAADDSCGVGTLYSPWETADPFTVLEDVIPALVNPPCGSCALIKPEYFEWTVIPKATEYTLEFYRYPPLLDPDAGDEVQNYGEPIFETPIVLPACPGSASDPDPLNPCTGAEYDEPVNDTYRYELTTSQTSQLRGSTVYWAVSATVPGADTCDGRKSPACELTLYDWICDDYTQSSPIYNNPCGLAVWEEYVFVTVEEIQNYHIRLFETGDLTEIGKSKSNYSWRQEAGELNDIAYDPNSNQLMVSWSACSRVECEQSGEGIEGGVTVYEFDEALEAFNFLQTFHLSNSLTPDLGTVRPSGLVFDGDDLFWADQPGTGAEPIVDSHRMDYRVNPNDVLDSDWEFEQSYLAEDSGAFWSSSSFDVAIDTELGLLFMPVIGFEPDGVDSGALNEDENSINVFDLADGTYLGNFAKGKFTNPTGMVTVKFCENRYLLWFDIGNATGIDSKLSVWQYYDPDDPPIDPESGDPYLGKYVEEILGECFFYIPFNMAIGPLEKQLFFTELQIQDFQAGYLKSIPLEPYWEGGSNDHINYPLNNTPHIFVTEPNYTD